MRLTKVKKAILWKGFKVGPHNLGITRTGKTVKRLVPAYSRKSGERLPFDIWAILEVGWLPARRIKVLGIPVWTSKEGEEIEPRQWVVIWSGGRQTPFNLSDVEYLINEGSLIKNGDICLPKS